MIFALLVACSTTSPTLDASPMHAAPAGGPQLQPDEGLVSVDTGQDTGSDTGEPEPWPCRGADGFGYDLPVTIDGDRVSFGPIAGTYRVCEWSCSGGEAYLGSRPGCPERLAAPVDIDSEPGSLQGALYVCAERVDAVAVCELLTSSDAQTVKLTR